MHTLRHNYREVSDEKEAKAGVKKRQQKRREIVVEEHVADLLRGVINAWQGEHTLAMDASALSDRVTILSFSVASRGCAIRVAWTMVPGNEEGAWRPHGERVLRLLAEAVPSDWTVDVMADRGLDAAWLFRPGSVSQQSMWRDASGMLFFQRCSIEHEIPKRRHTASCVVSRCTLSSTPFNVNSGGYVFRHVSMCMDSFLVSLFLLSGTSQHT